LPGQLRGDKASFCISSEHVALLPRAASASDKGIERGKENQIPVCVTQEIATPSTMRLLLEVQGSAGKAEAGNEPPHISAHIEAEVSRAAYKKMGIAGEKNWIASLPKAFLHVFPEQGE
jgi:hypothetical protein